MLGNVVFSCVANRVRSPFGEFLLAELMNKRGIDIRITSAGYIPQILKDKLTKANVGMPEPFFNRPMAEFTRNTLLDKGIIVPKSWHSKKLNYEIIKEADLIIAAQAVIKDGLSADYREFKNKIFTIAELSEKKNYPFLDDTSIIPFNDTFWTYCEEDPEYVSRTLKIWEEMLISAIPNITKMLGLDNKNDSKVAQ
jgi:protein-tyrosine-phosphatase